MNRVLLIQEKLTPPFCCTVIWKLFWIFKKNYFIWHIWKHSRRGWEHHVCTKRVCVRNSELICKAVRLAFLCQISAISFPFIPIPWSIGVRYCYDVLLIIFEHLQEMYTELKTLEWWISGLRLNPLFFSISRLNMACSPLIFNLQIN